MRKVSSQAVVIPAGAARIELLVGDITRIAVDAMVNAANSALAGGGGVDGAIHRIGGPDLMRELDVIRERIGRCETGGAVVTTAGRLPAKFVFHAVGPVYRDGSHGEPDLLRSCYTTCLDLARERSVHSISFPSISTGVYGYPLAKAAAVAFEAVREWLESNPAPVEVVKLIQFSPKDHEIYLQTVAR
jgi:O-acetyl-ADP-ribose deacetylase (regulator of RNase III)